MPTAPAQLEFVQEVPTSTIGDQVPNAGLGALILFSDAGTWYSKNSAGVVTALAGISDITATDTTIVVTPVGLTRTVSRGHVVGDVDIPAGSNTSTLATVNGNVGSWGTASAVPQFTVNGKGLVTAAGNVSIVIPSTSVTGLTFFATLANLSGDIATAGSGATTLPTVNSNVGSFGTASNVAQFTVNAKGLTTAAANVPIAIASGAVSGLGALATVSNLTGPVTSTGAATAVTNNAITNAMLAQAPTLTLKGNNTGGTANVADLTLTQLAAMGIAGLTGWIDVTVASAPVLPANSAATNNANINTILAAAANGSTIYFPKGIYLFSAAWTMPTNKAFTFQGQGSNRAGSPGTAFTEIQLTANLAGTFITLNNVWYTQFRDLVFTAGATQTAGACIDVANNVGTNFFNCAFQSPNTTLAPTTFWNDVLVGTAANSWNQAVVAQCNMSAFKGRGIYCDGAGSSLVVVNSVIQGNWGGFTGTPAANSALACIEGQNVGAMQLIGCDLLGAVNNLLLDPAVGKVAASVFCTNTYFDNSAGSCFKVAGAGATVRAIFAGCSFTTAGTNYSTPGTGLSAVEIGGSFAYGAGGQSISLTDCNILNTFATTGTSNGVTYTGTSADTYFTGCKVAGWTNGYNIAASGTNLTFPKIIGGACGPAGGYGLNTTGFNIAAGAYKGLCIQNVNAHGNTTALTLGAVTVAAADASLFRITDNTGINPHGTVTTPGVPTAGTTVTNTTGFRVQAICRNGATAPAAIVVNGVSSANHNATITLGGNVIQLDPGGTIAFTTTTVSGWTWIGN